MDIPQPRRPRHLPDHSEICLRALVDHGPADLVASKMVALIERGAPRDSA